MSAPDGPTRRDHRSSTFPWTGRELTWWFLVPSTAVGFILGWLMIWPVIELGNPHL